LLEDATSKKSSASTANQVPFLDAAMVTNLNKRGVERNEASEKGGEKKEKGKRLGRKGGGKGPPVQRPERNQAGRCRDGSASHFSRRWGRGQR